MVLRKTSGEFTMIKLVAVQWRGRLEFRKPSRFLDYGLANLTFILSASKRTKGDVHKFKVKAFPDACPRRRINS